MCLYNSDEGIISVRAPLTIITGNVCRENVGYGVELYAAENNIVTNNILSYNGKRGIYISSDSDYAIVTGNQLMNNVSGPAIDSSATTIKDNNYPAF